MNILKDYTHWFQDHEKYMIDKRSGELSTGARIVIFGLAVFSLLLAILTGLYKEETVEPEMDKRLKDIPSLERNVR